MTGEFAHERAGTSSSINRAEMTARGPLRTSHSDGADQHSGNEPFDLALSEIPIGAERIRMGLDRIAALRGPRSLALNELDQDRRD